MLPPSPGQACPERSPRRQRSHHTVHHSHSAHKAYPPLENPDPGLLHTHDGPDAVPIHSEKIRLCYVMLAVRKSGD